MATKSLDRLLSQLEESRQRFGGGEGARVVKILGALERERFNDAQSLIRFHEALLFLRAFPQSEEVISKTESILANFYQRVETLHQAGIHRDVFDPLEVSGIAGTSMSDTLSFEVARWLVRCLPDQVHIDWDEWDESRAMALTLPRFLPLLEDDAFVEADTPWTRWVETACGYGPQRTAADSSLVVTAQGRLRAARNDKRRESVGTAEALPFHKTRSTPTAPDKRIGFAIADLTGRPSPVAPTFSAVSARFERPLLKTSAQAKNVAADRPWRPSRHENSSAMSGRRRQPLHKNPAEWLVRSFEALPVSERERAEFYDSLRVPLRWELGNSRVSRTRNWERPREIFYHNGRLIPRSEVSLADEFRKRPPTLIKLARRTGERIIDTIRKLMLVRYRELYGTSLGDPGSVVRADVGRGVSIYLWNLPPERRLPLRAYTAGFTLKNGVPINYIEAIGLCEWMEVGFNTFYTFRGGEVAWIYAQVLRCLCHLMGTNVVSVYPYQLGQNNDEAIESGAFWFYRKLGFRPGRADLLEVVEREERKISADPNYRTGARTLRRLAAGHVFYELPARIGPSAPHRDSKTWESFSTRNVGLLVNERMAREFGGDARRMRERSIRDLARALRVRISSWNSLERVSFENYALALSVTPGVSSWSREEKMALIGIIRAKAARDEMRYLRLTQKHGRLRGALLGCNAPTTRSDGTAASL